MRIYVHYWEMSMVLFCPGNVGKDLHTTIKKKLSWKKKCLLISLNQHFTILHLNSLKNDLEKPKRSLHVNNIELASQFEISFFFSHKVVNLSWLLRFKLSSGWRSVFCLYAYIFICWVCKKFVHLRYTLQKWKVKPKYKTKEKWTSKQRNVLSLSFELC